jgi:hypothetical protein
MESIIKLECEEEQTVGSLQIKVIDITVKRPPINPETGLGDDVLRVSLNLKVGDKEEGIDFFKQYVNEQPKEKFEGYEITMISGDEKTVELSVTAESQG